MKRILFALMAVAAIAMMGSVAGCKSKGEPDPEDNVPSRFNLDTTPPQNEIDGHRAHAPLRISEAE